MLCGVWDVMRSGKPVANTALPADRQERQKLFYQLKDAAAFIGNKERTFTGNPFAFTSVTLENTRVLSCMMSLAGYDMDAELIDELAALRPAMNTDQRRAFYMNFLEPEKNLAHRAYLRAALEDRSIYVKELAVKRLSKCHLLAEDMEALADSLRSKSSSLRKGVLSIFKAQSPDVLNPMIGKMLASGEEYQIQAGIELLLAFKETHPEMPKIQKEKLGILRDAKLSTQTMILLEQLQSSDEEKAEDYTEANGFGLYDPQVIASQDGREEAPEQKQGLISRLLGKKERKAELFWKRN